jgi:succinyl-diaminopimelate desuccinylase
MELERTAGDWAGIAERLGSLDAQVSDDGRRLKVTAEGKGAHASTPQEGINAIMVLCDALLAAGALGDAREPIATLRDLAADNAGAVLGIAGADDVSGELTSNLGTMAVETDGTFTLGFSVRYPVTWKGADVKSRLDAAVVGLGAGVVSWADNPPLYVPLDDPFVATLLEVYRSETGDMQPAKTMGGGTYARVLKKGVAFGPHFPGFPEVAHQADEYWTITDLMRSARIYARALARLGLV